MLIYLVTFYANFTSHLTNNKTLINQRKKSHGEGEKAMDDWQKKLKYWNTQIQSGWILHRKPDPVVIPALQMSICIQPLLNSNNIYLHNNHTSKYSFFLPQFKYDLSCLKSNYRAFMPLLFDKSIHSD